MEVYKAEDPQKVALIRRTRGYSVADVPEGCIDEIRKLLLPRPSVNVIIFMCIGLGRKEEEIVHALEKEFDLFPVGVDNRVGTYAVMESTKRFPVLKKAFNKELAEVIDFEVDRGIVVGFNMIDVDAIYWHDTLMYYHWPLIYNEGPFMHYDRPWSYYVRERQPGYVRPQSLANRTQPKPKQKQKKRGLR